MRRYWKLYLVFLTALVFWGFLLTKPAKVTFSTILFLPQVFPQIPHKPWFAKELIVEKVEFFADSKKVVGTIYRPDNLKKHPALILAMGVRTAEHDKPVMAKFAKALARIGFVTAVFNLADLEELKIRIEEKETFIAAFDYLSSLPYVQQEKISFVGISVGSSIVLKAAEDPKIAEKLRALVFFGGYFDTKDYFSSLITKIVTYKGKEFFWQPHDHVFNHLKEVIVSLVPEEEQAILTQALNEEKTLDQKAIDKLSQKSQFAIKFFKAKTSNDFDLVWRQAPEEIRQKFETISPASGIENIKTHLFILHDRGDRNVSYYESRKLNDALPNRVKRDFLEVSLFEHVQPREGFSWPMVWELTKLYIFVWQVMYFVT